MLNYKLFKFSEELRALCSKASQEGVPILAIQYVLKDQVNALAPLINQALQEDYQKIQNGQQVTVNNAEEV